MNKRPDYIVVGRFARPYGVSGEIYVNPLTENPKRFRENETLWVEAEGGREKIKLTSVRMISGRPVVGVEGIDSLEQVKLLCHRYLYIESSLLEKLPDGRFYYFDLIGCRVVNSEGDDIGEVVDFEEIPANDLLVVESPDGRRNMVPIVKAIVKEVDVERKLIVIDPPKGLLDSADR